MKLTQSGTPNSLSKTSSRATRLSSLQLAPLSRGVFFYLRQKPHEEAGAASLSEAEPRVGAEELRD